MRREPSGLEGITGAIEIVKHVLEVAGNEVRQHEQVVELGSPGNGGALVGLLPEPGDQGPHQQLLGQAHAGVRRHFETAQLQQSEAPRRGVRRVQLVDAEFGPVSVAGTVDQDVPEDPIDQPRRNARFTHPRNLAEGDVQFVQAVAAGFGDARRLAGGPDKQPREHIG